MQRVTIKAGESLSPVIHLGEAKHFALDIPDTFTGTQVTFQGSGWDYAEPKDLYDSTGAEVTATVASGKVCSLAGIAAALAPLRCIRIRSGSAQTPTTQVGDTEASTVVDFGDDKKLTVTSGVKGTRGNILVVVFEMNTTDTLAITNPSGSNILVKLASTTATKNTAALIQAGIRALATVADVDVSGLTVVGSDAYNAAPIVGIKAAAVLDFGGGKTLTFTYQFGGEQGNGIDIKIENNTSDNLSVTNPADTTQVLIKLATTTASKNSASAIQTAVRALGTIGDYNLSSAAVTGSATYNSAPAAGVKAVRNITLFDADETSLGALTVTAGKVGVEGGPIVEGLITDKIEANSTDTLVVTWYDYAGNDEELPTYPSVHVKLASTTASKNSAANLKTAINTLLTNSPLTSESVYGGVYADLQPFITGFDLAGDTVWNASPPKTTPASVSRDETAYVEGSLPLAVPIEGTTAGGADIPQVGEVLSGGLDPEIGIILKD